MSNLIDAVDGTLVVDVDGTLCGLKQPDQSYDEVLPDPAMLIKLQEYRDKGYRVLLYTARNMRTYEGNMGLINRHTVPQLLDWLERWKVPYDEILFGKPWPRTKGFYIDDRAIRPDEFLRLTEQEVHALLGQE